MCVSCDQWVEKRRDPNWRPRKLSTAVKRGIIHGRYVCMGSRRVWVVM